jgi:aspartate racemase
MKLAGLLGGTSWPSTIAYYRQLNEAVSARLGERHSANLVLRSIDFHEIRTCYEGKWDEIPALLQKHMEELASYAPDCIVICNNALHKAYDGIEHKLRLPMPIIHIAKETGLHLQKTNAKRILLLGTKLVMEDKYYPDILQGYGIHAIIPDETERTAIQNMQTLIATKNSFTGDHKSWCEALLQKYSAKCDAAVLACTELPLIFGTLDNPKLRLVDPSKVQCDKTVEFMLS